MDRLTKWMGEHAAVVNNHVNYIDRLAEYEDIGLTPEEMKLFDQEKIEHLACLIKAEAEGRLIVFPCKVGDTVYRLWNAGKHGLAIAEFEVRHIDIDYLPEIEISMSKKPNGGTYWFAKQSDIGKTVFLTREEAEKALEST